jgi:hypothetical protein
MPLGQQLLSFLAPWLLLGNLRGIQPDFARRIDTLRATQDQQGDRRGEIT